MHFFLPKLVETSRFDFLNEVKIINKVAIEIGTIISIYLQNLALVVLSN